MPMIWLGEKFCTIYMMRLVSVCS